MQEGLKETILSEYVCESWVIHREAARPNGPETQCQELKPVQTADPKWNLIHLNPNMLVNTASSSTLGLLF